MPSRIATHRPRNTIKQYVPENKRAARRVLDSARWERLRKQTLRANPICACGEAATEVHHEVDRVVDLDLAFDPTNLVSVCRVCHAKITRSRQKSQADCRFQ